MLPDRFQNPQSLLETGSMRDLLLLNETLQSHGLRLSRGEAAEILGSRKRALKNQGRIELNTKVTQMLILKLSDSPYVTQENLVKTVDDLYETFHFLKNKTSDHVSDEELTDAIVTVFEKACGGSSELLMGKGADQIIENFNQHRDLSYIELAGDEEYWNFDE